jgi:hypothetical protein
LGGAEGPRVVRSHLLPRPAQGRDARGMTASLLRAEDQGIRQRPDRRSVLGVVPRQEVLSRHPQHAAIAERASARCRTSARDQRVWPLGR